MSARAWTAFASGFQRRRRPRSAPAGTVTAALAIATVLLSPAALVDPPAATPSTDAILAAITLGLACSALAFVVFFILIAEAGPSRASIITYVNPVVAVALGIALLDEELGPGAVAGLLLILAGSYLATGGRPPGRRRQTPQVAAPASGSVG